MGVKETALRWFYVLGTHLKNAYFPDRIYRIHKIYRMKDIMLDGLSFR